jgi:hypothetical protein
MLESATRSRARHYVTTRPEDGSFDILRKRTGLSSMSIKRLRKMASGKVCTLADFNMTHEALTQFVYRICKELPWLQVMPVGDHGVVASRRSVLRLRTMLEIE